MEMLSSSNTPAKSVPSYMIVWKWCKPFIIGTIVSMCYSTRETVELILNEDSDLEDFSDSGPEENIVDSLSLIHISEPTRPP